MSNNVIIYGKHAALAALENKDRRHQRIYVSPELHKKIVNDLFRYNVKIDIKQNRELDAVALNGVHQGIILFTSSVVLDGLSKTEGFLKKEKSCVVILDQVTDPQNIGAIIRSAAAFDADAVIMQKDNAPQETGAMVKASAGGIENVKIVRVVNISQTIQMLKDNGYWIVGLDGNTDKKLDDVDFTPKTVLVFGSEGEGMRQLIKSNCDFIVKIPTSNKVESLNVSTAAAIAMYEYSMYPNS